MIRNSLAYASWKERRKVFTEIDTDNDRPLAFELGSQFRHQRLRAA
ncbi:protein of unknown function [Pararobbsia alpina]